MKVLFIDRDGTMIKEPSDEQIDSFDKLEFYPKALTYLAKIAKELDYQLVMVTNQDGLGTDIYAEEIFWEIHNFILKTYENEGVQFDQIIIDKTFPKDNAITRKPNTGLLTKYFTNEFDLKKSFTLENVRILFSELTWCAMFCFFENSVKICNIIESTLISNFIDR